MPAARRYAEKTEVPESKSKVEIEQLLIRYGATEFASYWRENHAAIGFCLRERLVRIMLPFPPADDRAFRYTAAGYLRGPRQQKEAYEQERRRRWRALILVLKAKLEAVESGILSLEEAFFADLVLPTGQTLSEWFAPQLQRLYETGALPPLLPGLPPAPEERRG
jgi:hypothetical protein